MENIDWSGWSFTQLWMLTAKLDIMQFNIGTVRRILGLAQHAYNEFQKTQKGRGSSPNGSPSPGRNSSTPARNSKNTVENSTTYPGDYRGHVDFKYSPNVDGAPDPGEVVWTWVPFEEDFSQGKDRPVILVGRDGEYLLALMLTSKDRNNRTEHDSHYLDIGVGAWDRQGRPSEVKLDRVIRVQSGAVRREGAIMDGGTFQRIQDAYEQANN